MRGCLKKPVRSRLCVQVKLKKGGKKTHWGMLSFFYFPVGFGVKWETFRILNPTNKEQETSISAVVTQKNVGNWMLTLKWNLADTQVDCFQHQPRFDAHSGHLADGENSFLLHVKNVATAIMHAFNAIWTSLLQTTQAIYFLCKRIRETFTFWKCFNANITIMMHVFWVVQVTVLL